MALDAAALTLLFAHLKDVLRHRVLGRRVGGPAYGRGFGGLEEGGAGLGADCVDAAERVVTSGSLVI